MPPAILSSNLITISSLDAILASPTSSDPTYKYQLLSTKLAILTNRPSQPVHRSFDAELQILKCRLDLARACLELVVPNLKTADSECEIVGRDCKGILKRMCRENRISNDRANIKAGTGGVLERQITPTPLSVSEPIPSTGVEGEPSTSSTSRPAPTPISSGSTNTDSTNSTDSATSTTSDSTAGSKYGGRIRVITGIRIEALRLSAQVDELQGNTGRRERLESLALKLEAGQDGS